jgi:hypothetical protein
MGSTIARIGLCVLKLFCDAGATHDVSSEPSSEKLRGFEGVGAEEIDGEEDADVAEVSMVLDRGFDSSFVRERDAISRRIARASSDGEETSSLLNVIVRKCSIGVTTI